MNKISTLPSAIFIFISTFFFKSICSKRNIFHKKTPVALLNFLLFFGLTNAIYADVTLTSSPVAATGISQGSNNNVIYIVQMSVTATPVTVNNIQFNLAGTYDINDLSTVLVYFNATSPDFAGSNFLGSAVASFSAPHTYSINISRTMAAGSTGYFIIVANVNANATDNNTIKINGATNPVLFGFTSSPTIVNVQTDAAGTQTIQAADVTVSTSAVAASGINQGTNNNVLYIAQTSVTTNPVTINNVQFTLSGTYDANDISTVLVYFNAASPDFAGSSFLGSAVATFAAPHTYSINISRSIAAGSTGYFLIVANVNASATDNNTIKINGATNPLVFGFTTSPNIINAQTDAAGLQTIQAADVTVSTSPLAAANINQGTNNNVLYIAQMSTATNPVTVNNIQFTLSGTHDANDIATVSVYFNAASPDFAGSNFLGSAVATFAGPHTYSINISRSMAAGSTGFFIIVADVDDNATDNNTIKINGATNPVTFGFTTSPNITNAQTDAAGTQTIQGSDITLSTSAISAASVSQGTNNNILYITQMAVATNPVTVNNVQFTLGGTHDGNDLETVLVYFNAASPVFAGSSFLGSAVATFASPHTYSINISRSMAAGSTGFFIIVANVDVNATDNNTIKINGATNPVTFGFTTSPNIINVQSDAAGLQTIQAADITLTTSAVTSTSFARGTNNNIVYISQMAVATSSVIVNNIQFTMTGTNDANDLETVAVYFNATAPDFAGSNFLGSAVATFAAPHTYSVTINRNMPAGFSGYFIIVTNVSTTATIGNTVTINGATNPVVFGFTTSPNIVNLQANTGGVHALPVNFVTVTAQNTSNGVAVIWKASNEVNVEKYIVERSADAVSFRAIGETAAIAGSPNIITYNFLDASPAAGKSFYRINAVNKDGKIELSTLVSLNRRNGKEGISVYPNPIVKNGLLTLELQNLVKDNYTISIYNSHGQEIFRKKIEHENGNSVQTIGLPKSGAGVYSITVQNQDKHFLKTFIIQ